MSFRLTILESGQAGLVRPRRLGKLARELVEDLAQQLVSDELVVGLVGDDDAGASLAASIDVDGELVFGLRLAGARASGFCDGAVDFTTDLADAVRGGVLVGVVEEGAGRENRYTPATGEAGEVLVDGVDGAQLDGRLVVILPDLFRRSAVLILSLSSYLQGGVGLHQYMRYP